MHININDKKKEIETNIHVSNIHELIRCLTYFKNKNRKGFISGELILSIDGYNWEEIKSKIESIINKE